jgi:hypothetical protein
MRWTIYLLIGIIGLLITSCQNDGLDYPIKEANITWNETKVSKPLNYTCVINNCQNRCATIYPFFNRTSFDIIELDLNNDSKVSDYEWSVYESMKNVFMSCVSDCHDYYIQLGVDKGCGK